MALPDPEQARTWGGKTIVDPAGATIGRCTQVYTDDATGLPEWAMARTGTLGTLLPLVDAVERRGVVRVSVGRDEVMLAPPVADEGHISPDEEERLYRHYGIAYSRDRSGSLLPMGEGPVPEGTGRLVRARAGAVGAVGAVGRAVEGARRDPVVMVAVAVALAATAVAVRVALRARGRAPRGRSSAPAGGPGSGAGRRSRPRATRPVPRRAGR